ncbi:PKD domain-containing protein [Haliangium ochraceum]|uniref:PKD domain-containing protein n=1 Tax=Haliangium ochraceum TaxID=80816 RepID=UPI0002D8FB7C|nr:hypothetical protein [Haliangium ochraceum]
MRPKRERIRNSIAGALFIVGVSFAAVHATELVVTDPGYLSGAVVIGDEPVTNGSVTLRDAGFILQGIIGETGEYGPIVVQRTAEDGTALSYQSEALARFQPRTEVLPGADLVNNTYLRIQRPLAEIEVTGTSATAPTAHDFVYDDSEVSLVALTVRVAAGSDATLDVIQVSSDELLVGDEYVSASVSYGQLGGVSTRTIVVPVLGSGTTSFRGTVYLRTADGLSVSRPLASNSVDLDAGSSCAISWAPIDLSDLDGTGAIEVAMALAHDEPPQVEQQTLGLGGVPATPTQGMTHTLSSPTPGESPFTVGGLLSGDYFVSYARTRFADGAFLDHPYPNDTNLLTVPADEVAYFAGDVTLARVQGSIPLPGMLDPALVSSRRIEALADHAYSSPTRGAYASAPVELSSGAFTLWLSRGPWRLRRHALSASEPEDAGRAPLSAEIRTTQDFYLPDASSSGSFIDFEDDAELGVTGRGLAPVVTASLFLDVAEAAGEEPVLLRCPSLNGSFFEPTRTVEITAMGSCVSREVQELRFMGEPGEYSVNALVYRVGGSLINFRDLRLLINEPQLVEAGGAAVVLQSHMAAGTDTPTRYQVEIEPREVTTAGYLSTLQAPVGPAEPTSQFRLVGDAAAAYHTITASDALSFSDARVCIEFPEHNDDALESTFRLRQFLGGAWVELANPSVDTAGNRACGDTSSVSPFAVTVPQIAADAGPDQRVCVSSSSELAAVTLDGSGSSDPLGQPLSYAWSHAGGTLTSVAPSLNLGVGVYPFSLAVSDGESTSDADEVVVTVEVCESSCYLESSFWQACTPECPCPEGVGDCDADADCQAGLACLFDTGPAYGYDDPEADICGPSCPSEGVGGMEYCTPECPCEIGGGDCDTDDDCSGGLRCLFDAGLAFGYEDRELDVCAAECGGDGAGSWNYCTPECPCDLGGGDCDSDAECMPGLSCVANAGAAYGLPADIDVCQ